MSLYLYSRPEVLARLREAKERPDDTPETVRRRIGVYREQTEPLIGYYRRQGKLAEVSGVGTMDQVQRALRDALERDGTRI